MHMLTDPWDDVGAFGSLLAFTVMQLPAAVFMRP